MFGGGGGGGGGYQRRAIGVLSCNTLEAKKLGFVDVTEDQRYVVEQFLNGSDLFVSLPTGSGKSLCYWLLTGLCDTLRGRSGSLVVVVSPLVALMKTQVKKGIRASYAGDAKPCSRLRDEIAWRLKKHYLVVSCSKPRCGLSTPHIAVHHS